MRKGLRFLFFKLAMLWHVETTKELPKSTAISALSFTSVPFDDCYVASPMKTWLFCR